jgi:DNA mismatch endonuclease, patch repair protein
MTDRLTPQQRHECMSRIRNRNTTPELIVRRLVHSLGYRYRLHGRALPGHPDLVFTRSKKVIFVHGCFWHRHDCSLGAPIPASNLKYWRLKFRRNVQRDVENQRELARIGWRCLVIWQCELTLPGRVANRVRRFLGSRASSPPGRGTKPVRNRALSRN